MKIAQINTVTGSGSIGKITVGLYKMAEKYGDEAVILYGRRKAPEGLHTIKTGNLFGFYLHVCRGLLFGGSGFGSTLETRKLIQILESEKPDLLHLHNLHGFYLNIELLFTYIKQSKIPVVWTLHDCWAMTGHCAYFDYVGCNKWKRECYDCVQQRTSYPYSLLLDRSSKNFKRKKEIFTGVENLTIVSPSQWLADIVKSSFLKEYPVQVIPNGIDQSVFVPSYQETLQKNHKSGRRILGVANIWERRKGLHFFEQLARLLPEEDSIMLVGVSKRQQWELRKKEKEKRLPEGKITTIRRTQNQQELAKIYAEASVYVNTTLEDNFPTTNLEALACGTGVITFDTGGSPEAVTPECGIVVPKGDVKALFRAIMTFRTDTEACKKRAKEYCMEDRFDEYYQLYHSIVKGKNE